MKDPSSLTEAAYTEAAYEALEAAIVYYQGYPVGTVAACDRTSPDLSGSGRAQRCHDRPEGLRDLAVGRTDG